MKMWANCCGSSLAAQIIQHVANDVPPIMQRRGVVPLVVPFGASLGRADGVEQTRTAGGFTCRLRLLITIAQRKEVLGFPGTHIGAGLVKHGSDMQRYARSEERRVGKEGRSRGS